MTFYPFILMDVPAGNDLPDPYSDHAAETGQPTFPWRGRITCSPAAGYAGSVDKTAAAGRAGRGAVRIGAALRLRRLGRERQLDRSVRRLGPAADDPALRPSLRRGRRRRRLPDRLGDARADDDPRRRGELSGGRRIPRSARRRPQHPRRGRRAQLRRRLVGVLRAPPGRRLGRRLLPPRPALGRPGHRLHRHRQLHAALGLAGRLRASRRRGRRAGDLRPRLPAGQHRRRRGLRLVLRERRRSQGPGPDADHRRRPRQALGLPHQGPARLVGEPALQPPGRRRDRRAHGLGPAVEADRLHRGRLPGGRPRHEPAERLLRPEVVGELPAALLPRLARRRDPAGLHRGDLGLVGRWRQQPDRPRSTAAAWCGSPSPPAAC